MADSFDLLGLPEATTREATDLTYLRRGNVDYRVSMLTLNGGLATADHTHGIASASASGFMSVAMFNKLAAIDPAASNYVLPDATTDIKGGVKLSTQIGVNGSGQLIIANLPAIDSGDITDFTGAARDVVGAMVVGTGNVTVNYNPVNGTLTINGAAAAHTHTSSQITDFLESVQDVVGGMVLGAGTVSVGYNDTTGALTITGAGGSGGATTTAGITDYIEATQDLVGAMVQATAPLSASYDDSGGKVNLGFTMPIASDSQLGAIRIDPTMFTVSPTGVLALIQSGGGGTTPTGSALPRLVTVEEAQFGGSLGAGKTTAQRIANTAAFNAALAYCRDNKFALFITPGIWEIAPSTNLGVTQHIIHDNGTTDSAVHVFGHRSIIRQHGNNTSIWDMRGKGGSLSGVTLTYATSQTSGDAPSDAGRVKTITVTAGGTGYTSAPTVVITNVGGGAPTAATATAVVSGGVVTAVNIVGRGANYTTAPAISFTGGGGSGAAARADIYAPHSALIMNGTTNCVVRNVRTEFAWTALHGPQWSDNGANTIDSFTAANTNGYGVAWSNGTGNAWANIAITGEGASPPIACIAGFWLNNHANSSVSKLSVDSMDCQYAIRQTTARSIAYAGVSIDNCRPRVISTTDRIAGLVSLEAESQATFNGLTMSGTDLNSSNTTTSPTKLRLFAFKNGARAEINGCRVTNTRNKSASAGVQDIALIGPIDNDIQSNRNVEFAFRAADLDRSATTPHLIDRLSAHVIDVSNDDRRNGLVQFNSALGGSRGDSAEWGVVDLIIYSGIHGQVQRFGSPLTRSLSATLSNRLHPPYGSSGQYLGPLISRGFRQTIIRQHTATGDELIDVNSPDGITLAELSNGGDRIDLEFDGAQFTIQDSVVQVFGTPGSIMGFDTTGAAAQVPNTRAIAIPVSPEKTVLTTGTAKYRFHQPFNFSLTGVMAGVNKASTSGVITFNVLVAGTSITNPKITIPVSSETSTGGTLTATVIPAGSSVQVDCDTAGAGAEGAKVYLIGYPS